MTRRISGIVVLVFLLASVLSAQTFPLTVKAYWTPNPASDNVTSYSMTLDGGAPVSVAGIAINDANCLVATNPGGCILQTASVATAGQHTVCVSAVNAWGVSALACLTVNISNPGTIVWVKVTK